MEGLIAEFGLDYSEFTGFLRILNAQVCGEAAVYAYIRDKSTCDVADIPLELKPSNLRLLIHINDSRFRYGYFNIINNIMNRIGYKIDTGKELSLNYMILNKDIKRYNSNIYVKDDRLILFTLVLNHDMTKKSYDLSIMNILWTYDNNFIIPSDRVARNIRDMQICICCEDNPDSKISPEIIEKVKSWGFRILREI
jgi:hypothetical protein